MKTIPRQDQNDFGHFISNKGYFLDTGNTNLWLNVETMTFTDNAGLYNLYMEDKMARVKRQKKKYEINPH